MFSTIRKLNFAAAALSLIGLVAVTTRATDAAFTETTNNASNVWAAGTVDLTDNRTEGALGAMFNVTNVTSGGSGDTECIRVAYTGDYAGNVKLYSSVDATAQMGQYIDLQIDVVAGDALATCASFVADATLVNNTVDYIATTHTNFASGLDTWAPTGTGTAEYRTYRFTWTPQTNNAMEGLTVTAAYAWDFQSS